MAATKAHNAMETMVTVYIPKVSGEADTQFVSLNGKNYLIPRGKHVEVPQPVADIIRNREKALDEMEENIEREKAKMNTIFGAP